MSSKSNLLTVHAGDVEDDVSEENSEDGEEIEVDPLTLCQPEMASAVDEDSDSNEMEKTRTGRVTVKLEKISKSFSSKAPTDSFTMETRQKMSERRPITSTSSLTIERIPVKSSVDCLINLKSPNQENGALRRKRKGDHFDIWEHPVELKKLLIGDLANEMTVKVRKSGDTPFKTLSHLDCDPNFGQLEFHRFIPHTQKGGYDVHATSDSSVSPPPLSTMTSRMRQPKVEHLGSISPLQSPPTVLSDFRIDQACGVFARHSAFAYGDSIMSSGTMDSLPLPRFSGKEKTTIEDPETGAIRYRCRNNCGTSLASAKGRRKHEKRHCPAILGLKQ